MFTEKVLARNSPKIQAKRVCMTKNSNSKSWKIVTDQIVTEKKGNRKSGDQQ